MAARAHGVAGTAVRAATGGDEKRGKVEEVPLATARTPPACWPAELVWAGGA
jgi:hypothetical protein